MLLKHKTDSQGAFTCQKFCTNLAQPRTTTFSIDFSLKVVLGPVGVMMLVESPSRFGYLSFIATLCFLVLSRLHMSTMLKLEHATLALTPILLL